MYYKDDIHEAFIPVNALVLFKSKTQHCFEKYDFIETTDHQYQLGAGQPCSKEFLKDIYLHLQGTFEETSISTNFRKAIDPDIHYVYQHLHTKQIIFSIPPSTRLCHFSKELNIPEGSIKLPGLLFNVSNQTFSVYAFKGNKLNPTSKLYKAPFPNTDTNVCMGRVQYNLDFAYWEDIKDHLLDVFFNSTFSEIHGVPIKGNLCATLSMCIKENKPFPNNALKPLNINFSEFLNDIL